MLETMIPYEPSIDPGIFYAILMEAKNRIEILEGKNANVDEFIVDAMMVLTEYEVHAWAEEVGKRYPNTYKRNEKKEESIW